MDGQNKDEVVKWLVAACLQSSQMGDTGGAILLVVKEYDQYVDVRPFTVPKTSSDDPEALKILARDLADQLVNEAEAFVQNRGGGTFDFVLRAYRDGQRKALCQRPMRVSLDSENPIIPSATSTAKDGFGVLLNQALQLNAQAQAQNQEMHRSMLDMVRQVNQTHRESMSFMSQMLSKHEQLAADNFALLRANIENREGREQEAFFTAQKAQDWAEFKNLLLPHLLPVLMKALNEQKENAENGESEQITATVEEAAPPNGAS